MKDKLTPQRRSTLLDQLIRGLVSHNDDLGMLGDTLLQLLLPPRTEHPKPHREEETSQKPPTHH